MKGCGLGRFRGLFFGFGEEEEELFFVGGSALFDVGADAETL